MTLEAAFFQPLAEKSTAYFQHVQAIATEGSADFTKQFEANMADAQKAIGASVDQLVKNAPAGSEAAVAAFQNALSQGQKAVETAQATIKKASATAQANFAVATKQTSDMVRRLQGLIDPVWHSGLWVTTPPGLGSLFCGGGEPNLQTYPHSRKPAAS
jgi:hypothetical protein